MSDDYEVIEIEPCITFDCPHCQHTNYYHPRTEGPPDEMVSQVEQAMGIEVDRDALPKAMYAPKSLTCSACKSKYSPAPTAPKQIFVGGFSILSEVNQTWIKAHREADVHESVVDQERVIAIRIDGAGGKDDRDLDDPEFGFGRAILDVPLSIISIIDNMAERYGTSPAKIFARAMMVAHDTMRERKA